MYVGKRLRKLRLKLDITQADMATSLALSQSYYSAVEAGKRKITSKMMEKIKSKWLVDEGYFGEKDDIKAQQILRGNIEGVHEGVRNKSTKNSRQNDSTDINLLRDALTLYSIYATRASEILPEDLKHLNALITAIYINITHLQTNFLTPRIRKAIDVEERLNEFFDEEKDLPKFEEYITNKRHSLAALMAYKPAFEKLMKELMTFDEILKKIEMNLPPSAQIGKKSIQ